MSKLQNAVMVHPADVRVTTTAGDCINFKSGKKTFVPAYSVSECLRHGARLVATVRGTEQPRIPTRAGAGVTSVAVFPSVRIEEVEEVDSIDDVLTTGTSEADEVARNTQPYTPVEEKLRRAIQKVITEADPSKFTADLSPALSAIREHVTDVRVTASNRDRVWAKMLKNRDITQADLDAIFAGDDEEVDDSEEVLSYGSDADSAP